MKKWIALLLVAVLCLSLAACSSKADIAETRESLTTEGTTQDSSQDVEQTTTTQPSETEPQKQAIEITMDNWQDYFEIKQYLDCQMDINPFGEVNYFCFYITTMLALKEEYAERVLPYESLDITVEYQSDCNTKDITWNANDYTFEIIGDHEGNITSTVDPKTVSVNNGYICQNRVKDGKVEEEGIVLPLACCFDDYGHKRLIWNNDGEVELTEWKEKGEGYVELLENIEITRIQGTLTLS